MQCSQRTGQLIQELCCLMHNRMAAQTLALWLMLVGTLMLQGCCQHWSYGLSPGGKRELGPFTDTLGYRPEAFPHVESPFAKLYRLKELGSLTDRKNGRRAYKKRECEN